jgi:DNA-directed RNA polymerase specialized sigma24 family protein
MLVVTAHEQLPVRAARAGDAEAWNALFKRYQLPLYTYVFELIHHEQTCLDIVQESFINAARHINALRQDDKFGSWLFGIAHQKCAQHWRRQRPENFPSNPSTRSLLIPLRVIAIYRACPPFCPC